MRRDESLKCWRELFVMQHYNLASMLLPGILPELSPPRAEERVVEPLEKQLDCQLKRLEAVPVCPPNERELDSQEEEGSLPEVRQKAEGIVHVHLSDAWEVDHEDEEEEGRQEPTDWAPGLPHFKPQEVGPNEDEEEEEEGRQDPVAAQPGLFWVDQDHDEEEE